jgi:hypothetical protein
MKKLTIFSALLGLSMYANAQVKLQLSLLPDEKTYLVSMIPDKTLTYPMNITGTAQVTIKYPAINRFFATNIKSLISNVKWEDNAYMADLKTAKGFNFVSFGLRSQGTTAITYEIGKEIPLFTFTNHYGCAGEVALVDNKAENLTGKEAQTYNIGNHWTVLASPNEAYVGNLQATVNCNRNMVNMRADKESLFSALTAYPVPVSDELTIRTTTNLNDIDKIDQVTIFNALGQEVFSQKVKIQKGEHEIKLNVSQLEAGLYMFQFNGASALSKSYRFVVTR